MGLVRVTGPGRRLRERDSGAGQREGALQAQDPGERLGAVAERGEGAAVQLARAEAEFVGGGGDGAAGVEGRHEVS